ncbi:hypothetical protein [Leptolyngbya sp. BC1307]|uniref:hypothetical protein n=1 Tax=Leptolyngbya sp. BC1307 TaxID=2029589 RepID=UPI001140E447|nr:hypothetical protein [Leptolyngbya sp. BC1307]
MKDLHENEHSSSTRFRKRRTWAGAIAIGLAVSLITACDGTGTTQTGQGSVPSEDTTQVEQSEVPAVGDIVTVRGEITETVDGNGFLMESSAGDTVLIINPTATPFNLPEQSIPVQVTGQLETFNAADSSSEYGVALDPELYSEYDQEPVVIAQNFALAPTPKDLAETPDGYFDETVAIEGEYRPLEEEDSSRNAFALYEGDWVDDIGILVIGGTEVGDTANFEAGDNVVVTGQTREADESLLQQSDLGWDANQIQEFLSRYESRPILVAEKAYPIGSTPYPAF